MKLLCKLGLHRPSHNVRIYEALRGGILGVCWPHNNYDVCGRCGEKVKGYNPGLPIVELGLDK